jgi:hypothetical protein
MSEDTRCGCVFLGALETFNAVLQERASQAEGGRTPLRALFRISIDVVDAAALTTPRVAPAACGEIKHAVLTCYLHCYRPECMVIPRNATPLSPIILRVMISTPTLRSEHSLLPGVMRLVAQHLRGNFQP